MSVKVMAHVFGLNDERLKPQDRLVLLAYVDHADEDGRNIYPAVSTVAGKTGYSERTIQRRTRNLEELGLMIPDGSVYLDGTRGTGLNRWRYNWEWATPQERVSECRPKEKRVTTPVKRVTTEAEKGDTAMSPDPSLSVHNHPNGNAARSTGGDSEKPANLNKVKVELARYFTEMTGIDPPRGNAAKQKRWWNPVLDIYDKVGGDIDRAKALIDWTIGHMDKNKLTFKDPGSISGTAVAEVARRGRAGESWNGSGRMIKVEI